MQEIFNFLKENWQLIAAVITLIVSVVVAIIRKKPVSDIAAEIAIFACYGIIDAERSGVPGEVKKARCIEYVKIDYSILIQSWMSISILMRLM